MAVQNQQKVPDLVPINGSTNVYVGQRYVPKFYDDGTEQHGATWDKTKAYEPLTIVLWEGDSYTSRTFVPVGVEITNTQYWLETGNFNAQLEAYKKEVTDLADNVDELTVDVTEKQPGLIHRKCVVFTDGFLTAAAINQAFSQMGIPNNVTVYSNEAAGVADNSDVTFASMVPSTPDDAVTDVYFIGGKNDVNHSTGNHITNGIINCNIAVRNIYKNAVIKFGMSYYSTQIKNIGNKPLQSAILDVDSLYSLAPRYGSCYVLRYYDDLIQLGALNPNSDVLTAQGLSYLRTRLVQDFFGGQTTEKEIIWSEAGTVAVKFNKRGNVYQVTIENVNVNVNAETNGSFNVTIGNMPQDAIVIDFGALWLTGYGTITVGGSTQALNAIVSISKNVIAVQGTSSAGTITNINLSKFVGYYLY